MTRVRLGVLALALGLFAAPALQGQHAQPTEGVRFGLAGGLPFPTGDYATIDQAGWALLGLIQLPIAQSPIHLRLDGMYASTSHKAVFGPGSTKLAGGMASLLYHVGDRGANVRPYILGGAGYYNASNGSSTSNVAYGLGGGILFSIGPMHAFLETRYMSIQTSGSALTFVPVTLGLMFGQ